MIEMNRLTVGMVPAASAFLADGSAVKLFRGVRIA
jgi:hypothetical protein